MEEFTVIELWWMFTFRLKQYGSCVLVGKPLLALAGAGSRDVRTQPGRHPGVRPGRS